MGSCAAPSAKDGNQFTITRYLQQCRLESIRRLSPVAWQHIFLNGHYTFISEGRELDLDAMIEGLALISDEK